MAYAVLCPQERHGTFSCLVGLVVKIYVSNIGTSDGLNSKGKSFYTRVTVSLDFLGHMPNFGAKIAKMMYI